MEKSFYSIASSKNDKINWHYLSENQIFQTLQSSKNGLSDFEAKKRQSIFGLNDIQEEKKRSPFSVFAKQFVNPLILILFGATILSAFIGEFIDALIIITMALLAIIVGFVQEYRAERAIEALRKMVGTKVRVIRNGDEKIIDARQLVPGDIIFVSVGDRVPADAFLLESFNLETNEASLTGESVSVKKYPDTLPEETPVSDRRNILHMITTVTHGRSKAVVFATGMRTELGKIAKEIKTIEVGKSPFEKQMAYLGKILSIFMISVAGLISVIGFFRGHEILEMIIWGVSLAVAAVPEALPAIVITSLTVGIYHLAKQNAIVRRLPVVETLGSTTIICCDKTGTLTKGEMTVRKVSLFDKKADVTGIGYQTKGEIIGIDKDDEDALLLAKSCVLCNDAKIDFEDETPRVIGDPTEAALVVFASKVGLEKENLIKKFPRISEVQFSSERKRMTTINKVDGEYFAFMKGATEVVLEHCSNVISNGKTINLSNEVKSKILSENNVMTKTGLRVLSLACKKLEEENFEENYVENELDFIGLIGITDPPREGVKEAIKLCKKAGIDVIMITGDHKLTAESIAREVGIADSYFSMSGDELEKIDVKSLEQKIEKIKVFARVSPKHKIQIIQALKNKGHVVAMTGDGINDAPALKEADIGVSMGITGTQVTKEASDIILTDDNFLSIVSAVRGGRRIMDNVKKYLVYLLPSNIGEIILFASSVLMGLPLPLLAKHILFVNLATDGPPAIALGMEPEEPDIMKRKPRDPKESIFRNTWQWFVGISILIGVLSVGVFLYVLETNSPSEIAVSKARTVLFAFLVFEQLFFALSCRSLKLSLPSIGFLKNKIMVYALLGQSFLMIFIMNHPFLMEIFGLVSIDLIDWVLIFLLAPLTFVYSEVLKARIRRKEIHQ